MTHSKWATDLDYLNEKILKHYALFTDKTRKQFADSISSLRARLPLLANDEIIIGFNRAVALLNDGHTELHLLQPANGFSRLP